MIKKINELLVEELTNSFILWPIFLAIGIGIFFALPFDPSIYFACMFFIGSYAILWIVRDIEVYNNLSIFLVLIALGFASSAVRVAVVHAPKIQDHMEDVFLEGTVKTITIQDKSSKRLLLEEVEIDDMLDVPRYIRLSTKTNIDGIEVGDRIFARVNIMPIPQSSMVDGFNFGLYSYFKEIGGIAVSISKIEIFRKGYKTSFMNYVNKIRYTIASRISDVMEKTPSSLASALIIGDTSKIPEDDFNAIRISGIAHLMAISGLHIVTVVAITFFFLRFVLSKIPYVALRYDLKKIAAAGSILLSLCYLLISGMPISAQRAFLMSFLVLFAILLDRNHEAMRGVAIAALIILIATPENLFSPSLQMSFAACISLIASFKWFAKSLSFIAEYNRFGKYMMYVISVIFSTLVAGFATTPFVIYHFNQFSTYSVITNLIAIPLADFAIMPLSALSVLLMPLHLEYVPLKLLEYVLQFLMWCAHIIAKMPAAFIYLPSFSDVGLVTITFGMLILCFLRTKLALSGAVLIAAGLMFHNTDGVP
ncbi:MAG: ComEC/Rec2 family competence protein, partial [Alphaproteobacteria bacterium]